MMTPFSAAADRVAAGADARAEAVALVAEMTVVEKLGCLDGDVPFWPGLSDMTSGGYYRHPWPAAVVERLGIPGIHFADGPRGAVIADGTAFPVSMARGALFDPALEERVGDVIGVELRASGATFTGAVCMNLLRHPAWGRAQETYGEDPHHVGRMAAALAAGLERHVMACMKHFALNSMENARFTVDVSVDERALHEVYLPHFRHVATAGIASVMSAYNSVNGEWCGQHQTLLTEILRDEWGWDGFVVSDFIFGLRDAVASVSAGLDIEMPFRQQRACALPDALRDGALELAHVDRAVERIVATLLRYRDRIEAVPDPAVVNSLPHRALARHVASASIVMLRNEGGLLPVDPSTTRRVVVVGKLAAVANLGDGGSSDVKSTTAVTPLDGIRAAFPGAEVLHLVDLDGLSPGDSSALAEADLVVVVAGYTKHDEGEYIDNAGTVSLVFELSPPMDHPELGFPPASGETQVAAEQPEESSEVGGMSPGGDRASLRLTEADEAMIGSAAAANDRVVVAVQCGSAVMMPWASSVSSVLVSWYGGVEAGHGLADVLAGEAEPAGRLPFAIPTEASHLVEFDRDATSATYGLLHGQWKLDADGQPAHFPFGAGQGFTEIVVSAAEVLDDDREVRVTVDNLGGRAGSTVVFAFAGVPTSVVERPLRRLVGFARVHVAANASSSAVISLDWEQLDVRRDGGWWTEPGEYVVTIGCDAADIGRTLSVLR